MDCVTDAAATRSLHTQTCNFFVLCQSFMLHPSTAWRLRDGCLMRELYGLHDDCVTDGAVSQGQPDSALRDCCCCHTKLAHSVLKTVSAWCWCMNCVTTAWLMLLCLLPVPYCIATAWLMQLSHVQRPMSGGSGHASADTGLRDCWWCLTESAAAGCLIVLYCLDCVIGGAVARTGAIWSECVTTAWLMLRPHLACTSSLI